MTSFEKFLGLIAAICVSCLSPLGFLLGFYFIYMIAQPDEHATEQNKES